MTKVFIHLSGKINSKIERKIALVDIVYNVNKYNKHPFKNVIQLEPSKNVETEKIISEQLGILFEEMNDCKILDRELVQIFLNDYFSYTIKPAYYLVELILNIINKNIEKEIIFITSRYDSLLLPMFGFKTTESLRGSAHLFYASLLPQILKNINPKVKYRVVYSYGDTLSVPFFRNSFLRNVNLAIYLIYISKLLILLSLSKNKDSNIRSNLILVRNNHQARFAKIISKNLDDSAILFLPQLSQGSFRDLLKIYRELKAISGVFSFTFNDIVTSFLKNRKVLKELNRINITAGRDIRVNEVLIYVNFQAIINEVGYLNIFVFYKVFLQHILEKYSPQKFINFELVGNMSALEAICSKNSNVKNISIQTALISSISPLPIFPHASIFLTDSAPTKMLIKNIGFLQKGKVEYYGPPYQINNIKHSRDLKSIGFFTQPYEIKDSISIMNVLLEWCVKNNAKLLIRYHPRDRPEYYKQLLQKFSKFYYEDISGSNLNNNFEIVDMCITRTSSVAKEAIANGLPVILCLWTEFDKSVKADYIDIYGPIKYCAFNEYELHKLLNSDITVILKNGQYLQNLIFGNKNIGDLCMRLNCD